MPSRRVHWALLGLAIFPCIVFGDAAEDAEEYLRRIAAFDDSGPELHAVIVVNDDAPALARAAEASGLPLGGRSVLVKDNIETREWATTAGSLALAANNTNRDAPIIARLRESGGVVLGKTNLSEWANIRSPRSTSGWSAIGGLTKNPHAADRTACGSSSGSAAAVAAGLTWAAIGTETNGSITCPASVNGIVGFKPTVGLVSRTHIVPVSPLQDTAGPMARSVYDAALLLNAIAGSDPDDPTTVEADIRAIDFTTDIADARLDNVRIGVMRNQQGTNARVIRLFEQAASDLEAAGAELVDVYHTIENDAGRLQIGALLFELRESLSEYLDTSPADIPVRSLEDVIAFNRDNAEDELTWFGQEFFELAAQTTDGAEYAEARAELNVLSRDHGIDRILVDNDVEVLIAPTSGAAWIVDLERGDRPGDAVGAGTLPAVAGYPHLTVPMGSIDGLPVGLSFIGPRWSDHSMLKAGAAYESIRSALLVEPTFEDFR